MIVKYKKSYVQHYVSLSKCPLSDTGSGELEKDYFYWEFDVKPSMFSKIYRVLLIWDFRLVSPKVFILNDELHQISKSRNIPHLYDKSKIQLCLYYPKYQEFNLTMPLCKSIVPWIYLWLSYYEEWLSSDSWKGGGKHPEANISRDITPLRRFRTLKQRKKKKTKQELTDRIYKQRKKSFDKNK